MNELINDSAYAGVAISLLIYFATTTLKKRINFALFNPLLITIAVTIAILVAADVDYEVYNKGAKYLSWLLTPATVCLAIPLYEKWQVLKDNLAAILLSVFAGVFTSLTCVFAISKIMDLSHREYVTLLPKSITTAIGIGVSEELDGYVTINVAVIVITGVLGNMFGEVICKILRIVEPVARGLAFGTAAHVMGTSKAIELGETEGAMSSLAVAVAGLMTVVIVPFFGNLM